MKTKLSQSRSLKKAINPIAATETPAATRLSYSTLKTHPRARMEDHQRLTQADFPFMSNTKNTRKRRSMSVGAAITSASPRRPPWIQGGGVALRRPAGADPKKFG